MQDSERIPDNFVDQICNQHLQSNCITVAYDELETYLYLS